MHGHRDRPRQPRRPARLSRLRANDTRNSDSAFDLFNQARGRGVLADRFGAVLRHRDPARLAERPHRMSRNLDTVGVRPVAKRFGLNRRDGKIMGVSAGIAD